MENPWELYESHEDFEDANDALNAAWEVARREPNYMRAQAVMAPAMRHWRHVGAMDTEPLAELDRRLERLFAN